MISRNQFIKTSLLGAAGLSIKGCNYSSSNNSETDTYNEIIVEAKNATANNEAFWGKVKTLFPFSKDIINLNNGAVSSHAIAVEKAWQEANALSNKAPSYYMWNEVAAQREVLRNELAKYLNCHTEEIAFNRNTTEALNTIIFGISLNKGDEVVLSNYDYPHMINAWQQRAEREGIVLKWVTLELPETNEDIILEKFVSQISAKTKVIHVTHVINWTGQLLPAEKIIEHAHKLGIETIVDAAHSFAQMPLDIQKLKCDYLAAPGHKWLGSIFGTGFLFMKKQHISKTYPLLSAFQQQKNDIRKFETLGTRPFANEVAFLKALRIHSAIGQKLIQERLQYLTQYWLKKAAAINNIKSYTEFNNCTALATIQLKNISAEIFEKKLLENYNIHVGVVKHETIEGVRISPHIYTSLDELDKLIESLKVISHS